MSTRTVSVVLVSVLVIPFALHAAPSLPVTSPPVEPEFSWTGPELDEHAVHGQWLSDRHTQDLSARTHEFYDNHVNHGGGQASHGAIRGTAENIQYEGGLIVGFNIRAIIENDTHTQAGQWEDGQNLHGEGLGTELQWQNTLFDTVMTVEFAVDELALDEWLQDNDWGLPYIEPAYRIVAQNHDQLAWYCWNPLSGDPEREPHGAFLVPTWGFGDIAPGAQAERVMEFLVTSDGIPAGDPVRIALESGQDVLLNRTTSLKISGWVDELRQDTGTPYNEDPGHNSNVSVFHNIPEPGTGVSLLIGLWGLVIWRRSKARR